MNLRKLIIGVFFIAIALAAGCKMFEGTKIAQIYHNITAKYNGYFNARELMKDIVEQTRNNYQDDYNKILPIHRFPTEGLAKQNTSKADKVIKKCTKVIQKHEISKWTDDCYFQMGRAYFYKGKYISAIEMFRYVNSKYKNTKRAHASMIWVVYSYLQQGDVSEANAMITNLKSEGNMPESLKKEFLLAQAEVDIARDQYQSAAEKLRNALPLVKERELETRYLFILGQLNQKQEEYDKAVMYYNKVLSNRPLYEMAFHAKINKAACFQKEGGRNVKEVQKELKEMLKDDKNVDYKSRIYFELAQLAQKDGDTEEFIHYLNKALQAEQATPKQKTVAYIQLAKYHFENANYAKSKAYYDSTFNEITKEHENYEQLKSKKEVLDELIANKQMIQMQDSLQKMTAWSKSRFESHFSQIIENRKERQQAQKRKQRRQEQLQELRRNQQRRLQQQNPIQMGAQKGGGKWYFYNTMAKGRGLPQFKRQWGDRPLQDNWRIKTEGTGVTLEDDAGQKADTAAKDTSRQMVSPDQMVSKNPKIPENFKKLPREDQQFYAQIPFDSVRQRASENKIMQAYFNIGMIYYQDINNYERAIEYFTRLNDQYPDNQYEPRTYYYLYKMYTNRDSLAQAKKYKKKLLDEYPESQYATLIENPGELRKRAQKNNPALEKMYDKTYKAFNAGNCEQVRNYVKAADSSFEANYLKPKFEYLKILCEGKHEQTTIQFQQNLKAFIEKYQPRPVTDHAQNVYNYLVRNKGEKDKQIQVKKDYPFNTNTSEPHLYFILVPLEEAKATNIKQAFSTYNQNYYKFLDLNITTLMYDNKNSLILVRDFKDKDQAVSYLESVENDKEFRKKLGLKKLNHFVANIDNYRKVIKENKLPLYEEFFNKKYLQTAR